MGPYLDANMIAVFASLLALCGLSMLAGSGRLAGTAAILLLNWLACALYVFATGERYPAGAFFVIDYVSALAIVVPMLVSPLRPSGFQIAIGTTYAGQLITHAAKVLLATDAATICGWDVLKWLGYGQIALGFAWGGWELVGRARNRRDNLSRGGASHSKPVVGARRAAVARPPRR